MAPPTNQPPQSARRWIVLIQKRPSGPFNYSEVVSLLQDHIIGINDIAIAVNQDGKYDSEWHFLWQFPEFKEAKADLSHEQKQVWETHEAQHEEGEVAPAHHADHLPEEFAEIHPEDLLLKATTDVQSLSKLEEDIKLAPPSETPSEPSQSGPGLKNPFFIGAGGIALLLLLIVPLLFRSPEGERKPAEKKKAVTQPLKRTKKRLRSSDTGLLKSSPQPQRQAAPAPPKAPPPRPAPAPPRVDAPDRETEEEPEMDDEAEWEEEEEREKKRRKKRRRRGDEPIDDLEYEYEGGEEEFDYADEGDYAPEEWDYE